MRRLSRFLVTAFLSLCASLPAWADDPPALNPFGPPAQSADESVPGSIELSDGTVRAGGLFLTPGMRLKIFDTRARQHREFPLASIQKIRCTIQREWMEAEWRFKESANDDKVFTGRSYPVREYVHTLVLTDGRTIEGPLSGIVYLRRPGERGVERHILFKRQKGPVGGSLKSLVHVHAIVIGRDAPQEPKGKSAGKGSS